MSPSVDAHSDPLLPWLQSQVDGVLLGRRSVSGGCIHQAWCLELADGRRLFAKTNRASALPLLEAEASGLRALATVVARGDLPLVIPAPLALGQVGDQAVLLLEWLDLVPSAAAGPEGWRGFGRALAGLHRASLEAPCGPGDRLDTGFGWGEDNVIGASPQPNGWLPDWGSFFLERRLVPQLERLAALGRHLAGAEQLLALAPRWLDSHGAQPCLVHGDLWGGNAARLRDGRGALFDPAVHRGDREVDLAMAQLFGGFPTGFFSGYYEAWPLPRGHRRRVALYNLYHLLNHANLFGGGYADQAQRVIEELLARP